MSTIQAAKSSQLAHNSTATIHNQNHNDKKRKEEQNTIATFNNNSSIFILIIYNQKLFTGTRINFPCICFVFDAPVSVNVPCPAICDCTFRERETNTKAKQMNARTVLACRLAWLGLAWFERERPKSIFIIYWHFSYLPLHFSVPCVYHLLICGPVIFLFFFPFFTHTRCGAHLTPLFVCMYVRVRGTHLYYFVSVTIFFSE